MAAMGRWVNGSLEDLLMISISPKASSTRRLVAASPLPLRAERELEAWDGEELTETAPGARAGDADARVRAFLDELATDGIDLGVRLLVVDSIATMMDDVPGCPRFVAQAAAVSTLREALDRVCARVGDPRVSRVIAPDSPLGAYVKGLYLRASAVARALELHGFRALEDEDLDPDPLAQTLKAAESYHFPDLRDSIRRDLATLRLDLGQTSAVRGLRDAVEQLFVASVLLDDVA